MNVLGAEILFTIPIFGGIPVSETIVNSWIVIVFLLIVVKIFTHNLARIPKGRQIIVEKFVNWVYDLVDSTMGKNRENFAPYIGTVLMFSAVCSLSGLTGLRPPTSDLNTTLGWSIVTFSLVQINKIRVHKFGNYLKGFTQPTPVMLPMNIISEFSSPLSMAIRHFCNILTGSIIGALLTTFLTFISKLLLGSIGTAVPIFRIGLPAVLSLYFDLFASCIQAFVFVMLTMVFVGSAMDKDE